MRRPWPVTPMCDDEALVAGGGERLDGAAGRERLVPLVGLDEVVQLDQVDVVDRHALERPFEFRPRRRRRCARRSWWRGRRRLRCVRSHGCRRSSDAPYDAAVSMWLMPHSVTLANVASARSWLMPPSAAAPKITLVD